jgi:hypothetical protein
MLYSLADSRTGKTEICPIFQEIKVRFPEWIAPTLERSVFIDAASFFPEYAVVIIFFDKAQFYFIAHINKSAVGFNKFTLCHTFPLCRSFEVRMREKNESRGIPAAVRTTRAFEIETAIIKRNHGLLLRLKSLEQIYSVSRLYESENQDTESMIDLGEKKGVIRSCEQLLLWGVEDLNLRRLSQQIYSLPPLTTRETPQIFQEPPLGIEPRTPRLQITCSAS